MSNKPTLDEILELFLYEDELEDVLPKIQALIDDVIGMDYEHQKDMPMVSLLSFPTQDDYWNALRSYQRQRAKERGIDL